MMLMLGNSLFAFGLLFSLLGMAQAQLKSSLLIPRHVEPDVHFPVVFQMADKHTRFFLSSLSITFPDGIVEEVPAKSLYQQEICELGNWTIFVAVIPQKYTGLQVGFRLLFDYSKCNAPSETEDFCAVAVANRIYGGLPTLSIQPFECIGHRYRVSDIIRLYIQNWSISYPEYWAFSEISIFAERGKCNRLLIATIPSFVTGTLKPYHVIDWIIPSKYKCSTIKLVLRYTVTTTFGTSVAPGVFEERSVIPIHVE